MSESKSSSGGISLLGNLNGNNGLNKFEQSRSKIGNETQKPTKMHTVKDETLESTLTASGGMDVVTHAKRTFEQLPAEEQEKIRQSFEQEYGIDYKTRTRDQWKRLVDKYGIATVMKQEGLSKAYIKAKLKPGKL